MEVYIRKLTHDDLESLVRLSKEKLEGGRADYADFIGLGDDTIFQWYVLPDDVRGSQKFSSYGYFQDDQLVAAIGFKLLGNSPEWILTFIVTSPKLTNGIGVIKDLLARVIEEQERLEYYHWYVVSANRRFKSWQRLFLHLREKYHHFTYAVIPANQPPKKLDLLEITGKKIFPYDITISMYISKAICTS
jgi:hypothetical protein